MMRHLPVMFCLAIILCEVWLFFIMPNPRLFHNRMRAHRMPNEGAAVLLGRFASLR
jgi:hypothetical protein